uniref:Sushi domain containing 4 n=1 Tax=Callorhinchus milii TaxID=7868 RepID=A0A4W3KDK4_CALMI
MDPLSAAESLSRGGLTERCLALLPLILSAHIWMGICSADLTFGMFLPLPLTNSCIDPGTPEHGSRTPSAGRFLEHAVVSFSCREGYKLRGASKAECERQEDGGLGWEPSYRPVLPVCPRPHVEDADVYNDTYLPGDQLAISCHRGFQIRYPDMDNVDSVCQEDGAWDNLPTCQGCLRPTVFAHSYINVSDWVTSLAVGSFLRYQCYPGYKLQGPELLECMYHLLWSQSPPRCLDVEACPLPLIPDHGDYACHPYPCDGYIHGTVLEFYCDPGYMLASDYKYITCQYGEWFPTGQVFCESSGAERSVLSTWKIVAFTAISVLLALLLLVSVRAFHIKLKPPCQSSNDSEVPAPRNFVVVDGVPVMLPTYEEAVSTPLDSGTAPVAPAPSGSQPEQGAASPDTRSPPAYPGHGLEPDRVPRPDALDCSGSGGVDPELDSSSAASSFGTPATHPLTENNSIPETENTVSTSPSINIPDEIPLLDEES